MLYWNNDDSNWLTLWDVPFSGGLGMQTRPNPGDDSERHELSSSVVTDKIRIKAASGDHLYSLSEVQAYGAPVPLPAALWLFGSGLFGLVGLRKRFVRYNFKFRVMETNKSPVRLVFQLVFFVALKGTYFNMLPLARLEYELKSYAVFVDLLISMTLRARPKITLHFKRRSILPDCVTKTYLYTQHSILISHILKWPKLKSISKMNWVADKAGLGIYTSKGKTLRFFNDSLTTIFFFPFSNKTSIA